MNPKLHGATDAAACVLDGYLSLFSRVPVQVLVFLLFFVDIITRPAWTLMLWWCILQQRSGLPELSSIRPDDSGGVAVWAHIGGFFDRPTAVTDRRRPAGRSPWRR